METKKSLSATDICRIIGKCKVSGVNIFEFGDLRVTFHPRRNEDALKPGQALDHEPVVSIDPNAIEEMQVMDQEALQEAEEAQLGIDDPRAYEKVQVSRHIERARQINETTHN